MSQQKDPDLHADFSDPAYQTFLDRSVANVVNVSGAALLNIADGTSLTSGECPAPIVEGGLVLFGSTPSQCQSPSEYLPTEINEFVIRVDNEIAISCGSPGNRQFFFCIESADSGLANAVACMETLIGEGPEALQAKGGLGLILERDEISRIGDAETTDIARSVSDRPSSIESICNLYGLTDDGAATNSMQKLIDGGAQLKQFQAAGIEGSYGYQRLRFAPDHIVLVHTTGQCPPVEMQKLLARTSNDVLRQIINAVLEADDFNPDTDLPEDDHAFNKIIDELRALPADDLHNRLLVGGFANHSLGDEGEMDDGAMVLRCKECIYFLPHQRWCDLPELPLPVEADWYCKLWKL